LTLKINSGNPCKGSCRRRALKKQQREEFEAKQKADKELQEQKAKERADILKKQEIENSSFAQS
jgi:hypothetical protein